MSFTEESNANGHQQSAGTSGANSPKPTATLGPRAESPTTPRRYDASPIDTPEPPPAKRKCTRASLTSRNREDGPRKFPGEFEIKCKDDLRLEVATVCAQKSLVLASIITRYNDGDMDDKLSIRLRGGMIVMTLPEEYDVMSTIFGALEHWMPSKPVDSSMDFLLIARAMVKYRLERPLAGDAETWAKMVDTPATRTDALKVMSLLEALLVLGLDEKAWDLSTYLSIRTTLDFQVDEDVVCSGLMAKTTAQLLQNREVAREGVRSLAFAQFATSETAELEAPLCCGARRSDGSCIRRILPHLRDTASQPDRWPDCMKMSVVDYARHWFNADTMLNLVPESDRECCKECLSILKQHLLKHEELWERDSDKKYGICRACQRRSVCKAWHD